MIPINPSMPFHELSKWVFGFPEIIIIIVGASLFITVITFLNSRTGDDDDR